MRLIHYTIDLSGITPGGLLSGGVQGEDKASALVFTPSESLWDELHRHLPAGHTVRFRIDVTDGAGGFHASAFLTPDTATHAVSYPIPLEITLVGGAAHFFLVASELDENQKEVHILYSFPAHLQFASSSAGSDSAERYRLQLGGALAAALSAAQRIEQLYDDSFPVTTDKLADGSVTAAKLAGDAVVRYYDGSVQGLDGLKSAGMYYAKHPASPPLASGYSALLVWELFGTYTQLAVPTRSSEVYIRYLAGGTWSAWEKVGKVPAGGVGAGELAGGAVTADKLAQKAVTTAKLADSAVTPGKLAEAAVTEAKLSAGSVTETKLAGGAVTTAKIKDGAVTAAKLAEGAGGMPFQPAKALSPDTFITPGIYTDIPEQPAEDITAYGYLYIVVPIRTMEIYGSGSTFLYQVRINVNSGEIDMRYSRNNGAAWLDWTPFSYAQTKRETTFGLDNLTTPGIYETDIDTYPSPAPGYIGSYTILVASTSVETRQIWFCPSGDKVYMRTKPAGGEWSDFT